MKEELEKILFYFQLEVQSWNIGRPIHRTLTKEEALTSMEEALTSIINLVDKELPNCDSGCKHKDTHQGHGTIWWQGYNQAINDMRAIIRSNT